MMSRSIATDYARGMLERGELPDVAAANVAIVRMMGAILVRSKLPQDVRKAYSEAVKAGKLGHLKKDKLLPEAFFHPNARPEAIELRRKSERESVEAIRGIIARPIELSEENP